MVKGQSTGALAHKESKSSAKKMHKTLVDHLSHTLDQYKNEKERRSTLVVIEPSVYFNPPIKEKSSFVSNGYGYTITTTYADGHIIKGPVVWNLKYVKGHSTKPRNRTRVVDMVSQTCGPWEYSK